MPGGGAGWGIGPGGKGLDEAAAQRPAPPSPDQSAQQMAQDIHSIKERYVQPSNFDPQIVTGLAAGNALKLDRTSQTINAVLVCVSAGTLNVWVGDYSSGARPAAPHMQVGAGTTQQFMLPLSSTYVFTVAAVGAATDFSFTSMAL